MGVASGPYPIRLGGSAPRVKVSQGVDSPPWRYASDLIH
jgi:hypothetical protein